MQQLVLFEEISIFSNGWSLEQSDSDTICGVIGSESMSYSYDLSIEMAAMLDDCYIVGSSDKSLEVDTLRTTQANFDQNWTSGFWEFFLLIVSQTDKQQL